MSIKSNLITSHFATIYLTIISLLQGIALSQLVPIIITYLEKAEDPWISVQLLPLVLMLLIIFNVWHHYAIGIFFLRWFPNIIDTLIPFIVSIGQFILISFITIKDSVADIDVETWTKGFAIFLLIGSPAYFSGAWRLEPDLFTNIMSKENAIIHCKRSSKYYSLSGCSILIQALFAFLIIWLQKEEWLLISVFLFVLHLALAEYFLIKYVKPHFVKSMDELDAAL